MTAPVVLRTPAEIAAWRPSGTLGLVPTMGALHAGHASLIERAAAECDAVIVSIFVNPTQFNDPRDLERYPRPFEVDVETAGRHGASAIYAPGVETMYPEGHSTTIHVAGSTERWEGEHRPGHFDGVATVVTILLNQVRPDRSYFGEKDWQQLAMIRRMATDLALPGEIVGCPLVRDADGLALSSRNVRLLAGGAKAALAIPRALFVAPGGGRGRRALGRRHCWLRGREDASEQRRRWMSGISAIVDPDTLAPLEAITGPARVLIAARVGETRLIDTMDLTRDQS